MAHEVRAARGAGRLSTRSARGLAWGLAALSVVCVGAFVWLEVLHHRTLGYRELWFDGGTALYGLAFPAVGGLLASRKPDNPIGWLMLAIGLGFAADSVAHAISGYALLSQQHSDAWAQWVAWSGTWLWTPGFTLVFTLVLLLFPDGRPPSPRWRWALWLTLASMALAIAGSMLDPNPTGYRAYRNPLGIRTPNLLTGGTLELLGTAGTFVAIISCVTALVVRFRRSRGEEREQMKWFAYGGVATVVLLPAETVLS
jgi:hypothetical protein